MAERTRGFIYSVLFFLFFIFIAASLNLPIISTVTIGMNSASKLQTPCSFSVYSFLSLRRVSCSIVLHLERQESVIHIFHFVTIYFILLFILLFIALVRNYFPLPACINGTDVKNKNCKKQSTHNSKIK